MIVKHSYLTIDVSTEICIKLFFIYHSQNHNGDIAYIETRESIQNGYKTNNATVNNNNNKAQVEAIFRIDIKHTNLIHFIKALRRSSSLSAVKLTSCKSLNVNNCKLCDYKHPMKVFFQKVFIEKFLVHKIHNLFDQALGFQGTLMTWTTVIIF